MSRKNIIVEKPKKETTTADVQKLLDALDFKAVPPESHRKARDSRYDTVLQHFIDSKKPIAKFDFTVISPNEKTVVHALRQHIGTKKNPKAFYGKVAVSEKRQKAEDPYDIWLVIPKKD